MGGVDGVGGLVRDDVRSVLERVREHAAPDSRVVAVALVGSWARGAGGAQSDVDVIVLVESPDRLPETGDWFPEAHLVSARSFGAIQERRLRLPSGLEVELGLGDRSWASTAPVDPGTQRVAGDGLLAVHDPEGIFAALLAAVDDGPG